MNRHPHQFPQSSFPSPLVPAVILPISAGTDVNPYLMNTYHWILSASGCTAITVLRQNTSLFVHFFYISTGVPQHLFTSPQVVRNICSISVDSCGIHGFPSSIPMQQLSISDNSIHFWSCTVRLLSVAVECANVTLSTCSLAYQWYQPRFESGPGCEIRSSKSRHVCYRINILGSQLSPSSINLVPV